MKKCQLIINTCPDLASAERLANRLVELRLAACVNIVSDVTSIYIWKGERQCDNEVILLIKAPGSAYPAIETLIRENHPYVLPEIIAIDIDKGLPDYLQWIHEQATTSSTVESQQD
jgi:periplasmic divalent cation tolerance protein